MPPMKTIKLPEGAHWILRLVLAAWLLALAGCGPGTGGTGTGPGGTFIVGPEAMSPTGGVTVAARSQCVRNCAGPALQLEADTVTLAASCLRFSHAGAWTVGDDGVALVLGTLETTSGGQVRTAPATLRLQFAGSPDDPHAAVTVTLFDETGAAVLGPQAMNRGESAPAAPPAVCAQ